MGQRAAIYARVSTADQSCERQLRDLAGFAERGGYEVVEVFRETASGMKANRSARAEVMKLAQARHMALLQTWGTAARRHPVGGLGSIGEMLIEHNHG
ncbi:Resolvase, N terminal domain, partial [Sphingobium faniae]